MKPKHHLILYTFLGAALVVAVLMGLNYGAQARAAAGALEDGYTQRVLETQERLQAMGLKLGKAQVTTDPATLVELLAGVSRQADSVVTELSALPLSHVAMSDTMKFCNQLAEYSLTLALKAAGGQALSEAEVRQLAELEQQCALLLGQFVTARDQMLTQSLQMATESSVYYQEAQLDVRPMEQVADQDNGMDYPTLIYDGAFSDAVRAGVPKALGQESISAAQAQEIAVGFVGSSRVKEAAQGPETAGALAAYGVTLTLHDGVVLNVEVTRQGGKVLWMMPEHASFGAALTLEECTDAALKFLRERGFDEMQANHYQVYDGLAVINFAPMQQGVLLYPDLVKVQLRMDTGEVVGLEANHYWMNHSQRDNLTPALTEEEARSRAHARMQISASRLCMIPYRDGERLCWELEGSYEGGEYRVYVDAETGKQVELLKILQTTEGMMSA